MNDRKKFVAYPQYYYKNNTCKANSGYDSDCICWHTEGTGPLPSERYRWLRAQNWDTGLLAVVADPKDAIKLGYDCPSLARLDEQIDAAMLA